MDNASRHNGTGRIDLFCRKDIDSCLSRVGYGPIDSDQESEVARGRVLQEITIDKRNSAGCRLLCSRDPVDNNLNIPPGIRKIGLHLERMVPGEGGGTSGNNCY